MSAYKPGPNAIAVPPGSFFVPDPLFFNPSLAVVSGKSRAYATFARDEYDFADGRTVRYDRVHKGPHAGQTFIYVLRHHKTVALENRPGTGLVREVREGS